MPPPNSTDQLAVLEWHQRRIDAGIADVREQANRQLKMYFSVFAAGFAIAGGLITFAGWLGYKDAVDRAVTNVKAGITTDVKTNIVASTSLELERKIQEQVAESAEKEVSTKIDKMIADADSRYAQLGQSYILQNNESQLFLDVFKAGKDQPHPTAVDAIDQRGWQHWTLTK
jgi:hypothetical protein